MTCTIQFLWLLQCYISAYVGSSHLRNVKRRLGENSWERSSKASETQRLTGTSLVCPRSLVSCHKWGRMHPAQNHNSSQILAVEDLQKGCNSPLPNRSCLSPHQRCVMVVPLQATLAPLSNSTVLVEYSSKSGFCVTRMLLDDSPTQLPDPKPKNQSPTPKPKPSHHIPCQSFIVNNRTTKAGPQPLRRLRVPLWEEGQPHSDSWEFMVPEACVGRLKSVGLPNPSGTPMLGPGTSVR